MRHAVLLAAVAALPLGCGPLLSAEAKVERISVTTRPVAFPDLRLLGPVAGGLDPALCSTTLAVEWDVQVPTDEKGYTAELALTDFTLHLRSSGSHPPEALLAMDVMLVDPATAATTLVASYAKGTAPTPADVPFHVTRTDLMPFVTDRKLSALLRIAFDPADLPDAFQAASELGFSAQVTVDYLKL